MHILFRVSPILIASGLMLSINSHAISKSTTTPSTTPVTIELNKYLGGTQGKLNNKSALTFKFTNTNGSASNTCSIITTDNYLRHSKNRLENINLSEKNFYFDCLWNGTYYFLSNRVRTYAEVIIKQPDSQFPMSMHIEAKLVSLTGEQANIISGDISLRRKPD
ncbi:MULTISPECIES: hypothetical protein [unclassified Shewanella]|uniref:hypothetical protein n=1 Tax=unclassified Shewanella TaxID=196818 RepID=UPI001BC4EB20|nr:MULTISPECIES: hypothetical protein [unclassified Shewanella]GIU05627.1 hypothetical protein TUM4444_02280 [Shewanella sp. MBTL60-112-B1]GIU23773.1 hypothetical protein TUM4445_00090 [Shewanella sp. MBTL60-112-B2]